MPVSLKSMGDDWLRELMDTFAAMQAALEIVMRDVPMETKHAKLVGHALSKATGKPHEVPTDD